MIIPLAILLAACQPSVSLSGDQSVSYHDTPTPLETREAGQLEISQAAIVESVDALVLESWPLQVHAHIKGNLPDGCTTIQRIESRLVGNCFYLSIYTQRDPEAFCTQALVPFEESHPLDVYGLPAGTYTIDVYGTTAEFTLEQANVIQDSGGG